MSTPRAPRTRSGARATGLRALRLVFVVVVAVFLIRVAAGNVEQLREVDLRLRPAWLAAAVPFTLAGGMLLPLAWRALLSAYGAHLGRVAAIRLWCLSSASRYIPTGVAAVASRAVLTSREGVAPVLGGATALIEIAIVVAWGAAITGATLPSSVLAGPLRALLVGAGTAVLVLLPAGLRLAGRIPRLPPLPTGSSRRLGAAIGLYGANDAVRSLGFTLLAIALLRTRADDAALLIGAFNGATIAGMLGVTPAGIGVREGVLAALLQQRFGLGDAAALAVALRAWDFAFELAWLGFALLTRRRRRRARPGLSGPAVGAFDDDRRI